ncbi:23411_t:CDS:2 [Cetraspora pellucida]|uniref:23411_t:CDS:1 n=1 Tax=Cetraspora pellucida TaxID=1433469 RepID=A0A9N9H7I2_9GLOM|nr:23411_t:CDS:2 [Cetraspora pellucida]
MSDPIWSHFIQLGSARTHFQNCKFILPEQKKNYFGDSYEDENNSDSNISLNTFEISILVTLNFVLPSSKSSDIVEAALRSNDRPSESHEFELLDPDNSNNSDESDEGESEDGLAESDKDEIIELTESETELLTESDVDSEDE